MAWPSCVRHRLLGSGIIWYNQSPLLRYRADNPSRGQRISKCDDGHLFSCAHQTCATNNFSIPELGKTAIVLRDFQFSSLGLQSSTSIATSTDSTMSPATIATPTGSAISSASTDTPTTPTGSATVPAGRTGGRDVTPTARAVVGSGNHNSLAIGLGAGIPVGLIALAGLTVLILARRKINILTKGIEKSQADLLAYKDAQRGYEQQQSQTRYEAPFNGVNPELSGGRDLQQLPS